MQVSRVQTRIFLLFFILFFFFLLNIFSAAAIFNIAEMYNRLLFFPPLRIMCVDIFLKVIRQKTDVTMINTTP